MACPCFRAGAFFGLGVSFVQNTATIFGGLWHDAGNLTGLKVCFEREADMPPLRCKNFLVARWY